MGPQGEPVRAEIKLFGQRYTIRSVAPPEYLADLTAYIATRAREVAGPQTEPLKAAVLSTLTLADELFQERDKWRQVESQFKERIEALISFLEVSLTAHGRPLSP